MRSEFEKWYRDKYQVTKQLYFFEDTQRYEDGFAQDAWEVWQHLQTEVDELQKEKEALTSGYASAQKQAIKYRDDRDELQKQVEALLNNWRDSLKEPYLAKDARESLSLCVDELEQALKVDSNDH